MKPTPGDDSAEQLDDLAAEYVLGTLSGEQRAAMQVRLASEPAVRAAVDAWEARLLELATRVEPVTPSRRLWGRIERRPGAGQPAQGANALPVGSALDCGRGLERCWGLAASLLLAFALLTKAPPVTTYMVVLVAPSGQAPGWVVQANDASMIELIPLGLDDVPEGMTLQFWTKGEQWRAPVSLGLVKPGEQYRVPLRRLPELEPQPVVRADP